MNTLIIGLGSIGQRHYRNLRALGVRDIAVYRTGKGASAFVDAFTAKERPRVFFDLPEALRERPDLVVVANPTAFHAASALAAIDAGVRHIVVEKPIAHDVAAAEEIVRRADAAGVTGHIGYHLRSHPLLRRMREHIREGAIGRPIAATVDTGEYLPDWHPWEDYRSTYSAREELGGGVLRTQSHDLDYLTWCFGMPSRAVAFGGRKTPLALDTEDLAECLLEYPDGLIAHIRLDYYQRPPRRVFEVMGEDGTLRWDAYRGDLVLVYHKKERAMLRETEPDGFERNDLFMAEMRHVLDCVSGKATPLVGLRDGLAVLRIAEALRRSLAAGTVQTFSA